MPQSLSDRLRDAAGSFAYQGLAKTLAEAAGAVELLDLVDVLARNTSGRDHQEDAANGHAIRLAANPLRAQTDYRATLYDADRDAVETFEGILSECARAILGFRETAIGDPLAARIHRGVKEEGEYYEELENGEVVVVMAGLIEGAPPYRVYVETGGRRNTRRDPSDGDLAHAASEVLRLRETGKREAVAA